MDIKRVSTETLSILSVLGADYVNRLPKNMMDFLMENADYANMPTIDPDVRIEDNNDISSDTKIFLASLKLNYWCKDEEEKQELIKRIKEIEKKSQTDETRNKKKS